MRFAPRLTFVAALAAAALLGACSKSGSSTLRPFEAGSASAREAAYVPNRPLVIPAQLTLPAPGGMSRAEGAQIGNTDTLREAKTALQE